MGTRFRSDPLLLLIHFVSVKREGENVCVDYVNSIATYLLLPTLTYFTYFDLLTYSSIFTFPIPPIPSGGWLVDSRRLGLEVGRSVGGSVGRQVGGSVGWKAGRQATAPSLFYPCNVLSIQPILFLSYSTCLPHCLLTCLPTFNLCLPTYLSLSF